MKIALYLLVIQGTLGALDTMIYHEWKLRLPTTAGARRELRLHASRDFAYAVVFGSLAWVQWRGWLVWAFAAVLLFEIIITLFDFIEEDATRRLPAGERIMHTIMAIIYGAFLAYLIPELIAWADGSPEFTSVDYGVISYLMTAMALGVLLSGIRDLWSSYQLEAAGGTGG